MLTQSRLPYPKLSHFWPHPALLARHAAVLASYWWLVKRRTPGQISEERGYRPLWMQARSPTASIPRFIYKSTMNLEENYSLRVSKMEQALVELPVEVSIRQQPARFSTAPATKSSHCSVKAPKH